MKKFILNQIRIQLFLKKKYRIRIVILRKHPNIKGFIRLVILCQKNLGILYPWEY